MGQIRGGLGTRQGEWVKALGTSQLTDGQHEVCPEQVRLQRTQTFARVQGRGGNEIIETGSKSGSCPTIAQT